MLDVIEKKGIALYTAKAGVNITRDGNTIIDKTLEYFEKEYHIIKLERLPDAYSINQKQLINIY